MSTAAVWGRWPRGALLGLLTMGCEQVAVYESDGQGSATKPPASGDCAGGTVPRDPACVTQPDGGNSDDCGADCTTTCGNGVLDAEEACDQGADNSDELPDACRTNCQRPYCGDGVVDSGEECDGDQTCSVECERVVCGNQRLDAGEECDPARAGVCSDRCQLILCGNERLDEGEECEPPGAANCSATCLRVECGNARIDPGESCDPPDPGRCDSTCGSVSCGNGIVEEGEGCDPPAPGICDEDCRSPGCGDGSLSPGEECDPPKAGVCDGQCRSIECGNGRVDEGEQCDPPQSGSCDTTCHSVVCGNGSLEGDEECDPPGPLTCNTACQRIVCGDGRLDASEACEPSGPADPNCSSSCQVLDSSTGTEYLFTFDTTTQDWQLYATSPERLASQTSIRYDAQNGDKTPGVLTLEAPFDSPNQKIEVQASLAPLDMRTRTLRARVRLGSGLSSDPSYPGGIKLFAKSGASYDYASGEWTLLRPASGWQDVALLPDAPVLVPGDFDPSDIRQIGVELRTFNETTGVSKAVVYLDSISY